MQQNLIVIFTLAGLAIILYLLIISIIRSGDNQHIKIRDASLTCDELENHAKEIAFDHAVSKRLNLFSWPIPRLTENYRYIMSVYRSLNEDVEREVATTPAAEWLLDNFYIIEEQVKGVKRDLTKEFYSRLPMLSCGPSKGYARIYTVAMELVAHTDGRIDEKVLINYINAYQSNNVLTGRELWAFPIMVKIALVENIKYICEKIDETQKQRNRVEEMLKGFEDQKDIPMLVESINSKLKGDYHVNSAFIEHLAYRLRKMGRAYSHIQSGIDEILRKSGTSLEHITQKEHSEQTLRKGSIGNCIMSLKYISLTNWVDVFEVLSRVESILREDPDGTYPLMDLSSRNYYRKVIEEKAVLYRVSETHIARKVVDLAKESLKQSQQDGHIGVSGVTLDPYEESKQEGILKQNSGDGFKDRHRVQSHVGYYIMGKGTKRLENEIDHKKTFGILAKNFIKDHPVALYIGGISFVVLLLTAFVINYTFSLLDRNGILISIIAAFTVLIPFADIAVNGVNWVLSHLYKPSYFPKLELKEGITEEYATMVVIPALLPDYKRSQELIENLEVYYLANRENNLYFSLAGDFKDSSTKENEGDRKIVETALKKVQELNKKYSNDENDIFYFFHRHRQFNERQNKWMGWERKRGALIEFNDLLLGSKSTSYSIRSQEVSKIPKVRYVITLDADTILPLGTAKKLVGTMAHPLNRPVIDKDRGIVVEGHGLLQPRIGFDIESVNKSLFSRISAGEEGMDPYASAISDVYQDLFGEGIFTGKGIYDLRVFQSLLRDSLPDNTVLSHDLLEGSYVRAGLVTDLEFIDGYPAKYNSYSMRLHRWVRGDWQLISWLGGYTRNRRDEVIKNPLSVISRWKILDNLRRSLVTPSLMLMIVLGFSILPGNSLVWLGIVLLSLYFPLITGAIDYIISKPFGAITAKRYVPAICGLKATLLQLTLEGVFLPYKAFLMVNAITVTITRVFFTKKNMLEWVTALDAEKGLKNSLKGYVVKMDWAIAQGLLIVLLSIFTKPSGTIYGVVLFILWSISPYIAYKISVEYKVDSEPLSVQEIGKLRCIARKTWRYYEEFANSKNNYLAPDNYQEDPPNGIAYRTSPTNIGLGMLAVVTARDLGYVGIKELYDKLDKTTQTIEKMDKWNGHLYNWYDTRNLTTLKPRYVSTVDSGNFVCYLITLKEALKEYMEKPLVDTVFFNGIKDTINLWAEENGVMPPDIEEVREYGSIVKKGGDIVAWKKMLKSIVKMINHNEEISTSSRLAAASTVVEASTVKSSKENSRTGEHEDKADGVDKTNAKTKVSYIRDKFEGKEKLNKKGSSWENKILRMAEAFIDELDTFMPWTEIIPEVNSLGDRLHGDFKNSIDEIGKKLQKDLSLVDASKIYKETITDIEKLLRSLKGNRGNESEGTIALLEELKNSLGSSLNKVDSFSKDYINLMERINSISVNTRFLPLYDEKRQLFSIGFNIEESSLTNSYYDLLASEARQTSYIAIARGEIDPVHWFKLGRTLTQVDRYKGMVSWSGTMFEYLMPLLIMKTYKNTLLDETYSFVVKSQKKYGSQRNVPWGTSESGFYSLDINLDYQYKAFGVPWLGLKRGLVEDMVVAPYASMLSLAIDPKESYKNLMRLYEDGVSGPYGFYEAVDYTPERLPIGEKRAIVKSYMAHHQGMGLLSLDNQINDNIMQKRFHNDPVVDAAKLLLQEKVPSNIVFTKENKEKITPFKDPEYQEEDSYREYESVDEILPKAHILSNGNYSVMLTDSGTGYSKSKALDVTRWREDAILDRYGMFLYIKNTRSNKIWSSTFNPQIKKPESYKVVFTSGQAKYYRKDGEIDTLTEVVVCAGDNGEIRRLTITNHGKEPCVLEVTSYFEVVLAHHGADIAHPAFSNLFIRTEYIPELNCIIANRRPRSENDNTIWMVNTVLVEGEAIGGIQYETDRMQFIGRGKNSSDPIVLSPSRPLSNTVGAVLDPVMSFRQMVKVEGESSIKISFITALAEDRQEALDIASKYKSSDVILSEFNMAVTRSKVEAKYLNLKTSEIEFYQELISHILFLSPLSLKKRECILNNVKGQSSLWSYGISGDTPIVLVVLEKTEDIDILYEVLKAHEYWKFKKLKVDLVVINEEENSYTNPLNRLIDEVIMGSHAHDSINKPGGVFLLKGSNLPKEDIDLICSTSRLVLKGGLGDLKDQIKLLPKNQNALYKDFYKKPKNYDGELVKMPELSFYNGLGGFASNGKEYVIYLENENNTPLPWINVISNPKFGFLVSESGGGYTWANNSREYKLTPWSNDPVSDIPQEILYIMDDETGDLWTITPLPIREKEPYLITHGFGYTVFNHVSHGISQEMTQYVPAKDSAKINIVKLRNISKEKRKLSITYYIRPVLGVSDQFTAPHVSSSRSKDGTIILKNSYNDEFRESIPYVDCSLKEGSFTCDRFEFFGEGDYKNPEGIRLKFLSGTTGAGFDHCVAINVNLDFSEDEEKELVFVLGCEKSEKDIEIAAKKYTSLNNAKKALEEVKDFWKQKLEMVQFYTPDPAMDYLVNGWLMYQVISSRVWTRSAFYQSGGAFGFRDQLQDSLSVAHVWPEITRNQILLHSKHQFVEGDVQHWWHEEIYKGTRTRFSDDLLWMPYVTAEYIRITGDFEILDIDTPFLEDEPLRDDEDEAYRIPKVSQKVSSLYDHCIRAIERSLKTGEHGIPLIGSGDWNDGMNTIGNKGKGESVWMGWFLYSILNYFAPICEKKGEKERAEKYIQASGEIIKSIEENAWDGSWYRRAYFDNGVPLGSIQNSECKIDSLSQSWAVISGAGNKERTVEAMNALENYLIKRDEGLIKLLTPPFDEGDLEPGYIKSYVPGVRENGGQYTHAAAWVVLAFAKMGDGDKAVEMFELLNPINHSRTQIEYSKYKVEPYVMAADVYSVDPHIGRGGWTWYTGAAGWMYRVGMEYILGFKKNGDKLEIDPCIPKKWKGFDISYKYGKTQYAIEVKNPNGVNKGISKVVLDGNEISEKIFNLTDDGVKHRVEVIMG